MKQAARFREDLTTIVDRNKEKIQEFILSSRLDFLRIPFFNYLKEINLIALISFHLEEMKELNEGIKKVIDWKFTKSVTATSDTRAMISKLLSNVAPSLYDENYRLRDHIMRNVPKDNSKKNQKKKAGRKAKKIRHAENENVDLEDDLDEESTVIENGMGEDNESITVIDSNLAVFEIDD